VFNFELYARVACHVLEGISWIIFLQEAASLALIL